MPLNVSLHILGEKVDLKSREDEACALLDSLKSTRWREVPTPLDKNVLAPIDDLEQLEDFGSTDFWDKLRIYPRASYRAINTMIPEPHFIAQSEKPGKPRSRLAKITAPRICDVIKAGAENILEQPHARLSWIVPIFGIPPSLKLISQGAVLGLRPPPPHPAFSVIKWLPDDLLVFWRWLIETQSKYVFGPLALAFDSAKAERKSTSSRKSPSSHHFIRIYHDATISLKLRKYLGAFDACQAGQSTKSKESRRVLKSARLLLVDEEGHGLLTA